jgi:hypothetical protein
MPVMGVAKVILPGVDGINYFIVDGALKQTLIQKLLKNFFQHAV